jgi:glycosyltransferase involved in cell wall biosynthesis
LTAGAIERVPAVSVCIPAYNGQEFIGATIQSVLHQTLEDFEIIVVDDASTDATVDVVGRFRDPRLRLIINPVNTGIGANWNRAVRECRGKHVKFLCHDDLLYPNCLDAQSKVLDDPANRDLALVCAPRDIIDENGRVLLHARGPAAKWGKLDGAAAIRRIVRSGSNALGEPAAVLFRRDAYAQTSGFDPTLPYMIDLDFWCKILKIGGMYAVAPTLCAFRVTRTALSTRLAKTQAAETSRLFRQLAMDPQSTLRPADLRIGQIKTSFLAPARRLLYRLLWRR